MTYLVATLIVVGLVQILLSWKLLEGLYQVRRADDRLSHLADALGLLTETNEAGFRAMALEVGRLGESRALKDTPRPSTRRLATAARRGRSIEEIAAAEQVSEGEVRLRLHMAAEQTRKSKNGRSNSEFGIRNSK